ncbi:hypothetical protein L226DRAFT_494022 [Lentinus tigrinus ALCF2SS1-7]|uniref:Fungal-type protein kinase domain-containing protein n=1 Tax=Lentinus tigrinus ALCF2SS1-6 TaxID=1328759 RepID=A0A5C2RQ28_9APHY|nr:hypothetical protein L227DRAFT_558080 [Lentinus tigrinus ALCF2SS1-6]RPD69649.1 hypothetical protein L226DRAFT_494022 [Lentinus tigrinus ALCF2SS1-7]
MDLDGIANNIKEVSLKTMFDVFMPCDHPDPPQETLDMAYYVADSELGTSGGSKRKHSESDDDSEPPPKWTFTVDICKISKSMVEVASAPQREGSPPTKIVTHDTPPASIGLEHTRDDDGYRSPIRPAGGTFLVTEHNAAHVDPPVIKNEARKEWVGRFSWAELAVPIEVRVDDYDSAFTFGDQREHHLKKTRYGNEALERVLKYVGQLFSYHHRTHVYILYVLRHQARVLYFDRAYTLVSEPFKYGTRADVALHQFFWRLGRMSREQLGFDPTVVPANPEDVKRMFAYAPDAPSDYIEQQIYDTLSVDAERPSSTLVSDKTTAYELTMCGRRYIVGRPMYMKPFLQGYCTHGFLAYDIEEGTVRFIKECWRPALKRVVREHEAYEDLNGKGVQYVLTCLAHEDVPGSDGAQITRSQEVIKRSCAPFRHYRLLFKEVCRPVTDFEDFGAFTTFMCHALLAHRDAWQNAKILHKDVSVHNILIYEVGRGPAVKQTGMLCDWDCCQYRVELELDQSRGTPNYAGTWRFRSALSLQFPDRPHELSDDIESFVHIYHYCVLRFHQTSFYFQYQFENFVMRTFEDVRIRESDGAEIGGDSKLSYMTEFADPRLLVPISVNPTLRELLTDIRDLCREHYAAVDIKSLREAYDPPSPPPSPVEYEEQPSPARLAMIADLMKMMESSERLQKTERVKRKSESDSEPTDVGWTAVTVPKATVPPARLTMRDHEELLEVFLRYTERDEEGKLIHWPAETTKCEDLFRSMDCAPPKCKGFSSSWSDATDDDEDGTVNVNKEDGIGKAEQFLPDRASERSEDEVEQVLDRVEDDEQRPAKKRRIGISP